MSAREQLKELLLEKSVKKGDFTLASGKKSDLYVDCRVTAMDCHGACLVGQVGWDLVKDLVEKENLDCIGGMTMGADPVSLAVGMTSAQNGGNLQVFTIRKEPKDHGRGKQIEGNFSEGNRVLIVDDVITTGGSTLKAIEAVRKAGGTVVAALVLVDREEGGREAIEAEGVPVHPMFTRTQLFS